MLASRVTCGAVAGGLGDLDVDADPRLQRPAVTRCEDRRREQGNDGDADHRRQRALDRQRFDLEVLRAADAEEHDHEQE